MIQKFVHVAWKDKSVINDESPLVVNGIANIKKLNSDWQLAVSDDADIENYLKHNLSISDYDVIKSASIVDKCDLWRLLKIYYEGGVYVDIDRFCNISFDTVFQSHIKWVLPINNNFDFSHDFMCSESGNPVFLRTIELNLQRRHQGITNTYFLGAQTYMHAITEILTGKIVDTNPGQQYFDYIQQELRTIEFIKSQVEYAPHNTIIYNDPSESLNLLELKTQLYSKYEVTHWNKI